MKVLLAEDSRALRTLLMLQLKRWDYEITEAEDGEQAWEYFQAGDFHLVLTDWMMPKVDGLELIRRIRTSDKQGYVYVILLTSKTERDDLVEGMEAGADDFLVKPCDAEELRVRLREGQRIIRLEQALAEQNRRLRETQASLVQSEKLASVGQLAAGMAHEINNPVAFVTNNLAVLQRDVSDLMQLLALYEKCDDGLSERSPETAEQIKRLREELDIPWLRQHLPQLFESSSRGLGRVREIISNLRDFAHLDEAEYDRMAVVPSLQSTLDVLQHEIDKTHLVIRTRFTGEPVIFCQPAKVKQLFHGVLQNAVQACAEGGTIEIATRVEQDSVVVEISDTGCGMDAVTRERAFEPFYTTKPVGSGTGLGLSICYGIVRDHGGTISIDSEPGQGTTLRICLPFQPPPGTMPETAMLPTQKNSHEHQPETPDPDR